MRGRVILVALVMLGLIGLSLGPTIFAQQPQEPISAAKSKDDGWSLVEGHADYWKTQWGEQKVTLMKGHVRFVHKDTMLASDLIEYDKPTQVAVSPGMVTITNPECDIKGVKGTAYFKKKLGVIEGSVEMLVKPKQTEAEKSDKDSVAKFKTPTSITCEKLEYFYKDKVASATGGVVFKQEKRTASADKAVYDQKKEILTLTGNVKGSDEDGQTFNSPSKVVMCLKKGEEWIEVQNANTKFKIDLGEEEGKKE
ncbi:MAG: LPS export ABC transporter periplasmic protein LptC [Armatimonadetes bacterium]|nr:LPS export ABC transporter periplasmic protein LptC [Armatimonadota bacterium]